MCLCYDFPVDICNELCMVYFPTTDTSNRVCQVVWRKRQSCLQYSLNLLKVLFCSGPHLNLAVFFLCYQYAIQNSIHSMELAISSTLKAFKTISFLLSGRRYKMKCFFSVLERLPQQAPYWAPKNFN